MYEKMIAFLRKGTLKVANECPVLRYTQLFWDPHPIIAIAVVGRELIILCAGFEALQCIP